MEKKELPLPSDISKKLNVNRDIFFKLESGNLSSTSMSMLRKKNPEKYELMTLGLICYKNNISINELISLVHLKNTDNTSFDYKEDNFKKAIEIIEFFQLQKKD